MGDLAGDRRIALRPDGDADVRATLGLIAAARSELAEARSLPDIVRLIETASVAREAAQRAAKLAQAQRMAAGVVEAANAAANDAAAVRIEAQAKAGELLHELRDRGEIVRHGGDRARSQAATLLDLGISKSDSSRWQQVAAIPSEQRASYVEETRAAGGEVSTAGLLRHAHEPEPPELDARRSIDHAGIAADARKHALKVYRDLVSLPGFRPESLVSALDKPQRRHLVRSLDQLVAWIDDVRREVAVHRIGVEEA